jgi:putative transposase
MLAGFWWWTARRTGTKHSRTRTKSYGKRWWRWRGSTPRYGYRRLWAILERRGWKANVKRIYRLYREEGLIVRRLKRKRLSRQIPVDSLLTGPNQEWALDFVSDALAGGRALRALTIVDSYTRECPAIEVSSGLSSQQVTRTLEKIIPVRGKPKWLRCDNGPEFTWRGANRTALL